jgi:hypothetical protein
MKKVLLALVVLTSLGSSRPGCNPYKPKRDRDGDEEKQPHKVAEICKKLAGECSSSCFRREASYSCEVCCDEKFILCDNNEKYDFAPCELIDPAPAPSPGAGPGDAGSSTAPGKAPSAGSPSRK